MWVSYEQSTSDPVDSLPSVFYIDLETTQAKYCKWHNHKIKAAWIPESPHGRELSWTVPQPWMDSI